MLYDFGEYLLSQPGLSHMLKNSSRRPYCSLFIFAASHFGLEIFLLSLRVIFFCLFYYLFRFLFIIEHYRYWRFRRMRHTQPLTRLRRLTLFSKRLSLLSLARPYFDYCSRAFQMSFAELLSMAFTWHYAHFIGASATSGRDDFEWWYFTRAPLGQKRAQRSHRYCQLFDWWPLQL